jgi:hypothetical protein
MVNMMNCMQKVEEDELIRKVSDSRRASFR